MNSKNNRHAILIIANGNLETLFYNIKILDNERIDLFIHLDKKNDRLDELKKFVSINIKKSKVYFLEQKDLRWGDFSLVQCELELLKNSTKKGYKYYHLISESDMIITKPKDMLCFFDKFDCEEFIDIRPMPNNIIWHGRYKCRNFFVRNQKSKIKIFKLINYILILFQILFGVNKPKKYHVDVKYGSQWFSITDNLAKYIISQETMIYKLFSTSCCADEHFLQTIVFNSDFQKNVSKYGNLRYIKWQNGKSSPDFFRTSDLQSLLDSKAIFARKFSTKIDDNIIKALSLKLEG